ncbi:hypothetical protein GCK72_020023 [Caenorhabditis remanei]|uniref:7TM GPCR serpentine receptor class x (Srx) domain-containing protein n=1 Tax=Caenorhabditis remanei TaxID=31234 RepID=A0A6A5GFI7_CAERE|nr:hypothetical protein GCK72_020023 [Caenorhabditis remanei]KAF1753466.1 hypothetical protein GCK72_020023 [Caenorhabditis remanei]
MESGNQTALALIPITLIGAILNWSILYANRKLSFFNNSFGYLSANQAFVDALHSTIFLLYFCPMVLLDQPVIKHYSFIMGHVLLFCYESSVLTHFLISINRFCAAWNPLSYDMFRFARRFSQFSLFLVLALLAFYILVLRECENIFILANARIFLASQMLVLARDRIF